MKTGRASERPSLTPMLSEGQDLTPTERNKIKASFLQREKTQQENYIKDLEKSLRINKELISSLTAGDPKLERGKATIDKLNQENAFLHTQIKTLKGQRDDYHAKWLIAQQIVEEFKVKEKAELALHRSEIDELRAQLDEKEYAAQLAQQKFNKVESALQKSTRKDKNLCFLLMELHADLECVESSKKISNVIEENRRLQSELGAARAKITTLASHSVEHPTEPKDLSPLHLHPKVSSCGHSQATECDAETLAAANSHLRDEVTRLEKKNRQLVALNLYLQTTIHSLSSKGHVIEESVDDFGEHAAGAGTREEPGVWDVSSILQKADQCEL